MKQSATQAPRRKVRVIIEATLEIDDDIKFAEKWDGTPNGFILPDGSQLAPEISLTRVEDPDPKLDGKVYHSDEEMAPLGIQVVDYHDNCATWEVYED